MSMLFLGSRSDPHFHRVASVLAGWGVEPLFVDHLAGDGISLSLPEARLRIGQDETDLSSVRLAWYRPKIAYRRFGIGEAFVHEYMWGVGWRSFTEELADLLGNRAVNSSASVRNSSCKLSQLVAARGLGFLTPETLVSNAPETVRSWARGQVSTITKSLGEAMIPEPESERGFSSIMTTRVDWTLFERNLEGVRSFPGLYQREIPKQFELRVAVQGASLFAFKIDSQTRPYTKVDWRYGTPLAIYEEFELPVDVQDRIFAYLRHFDLYSGHFDFVVQPDGSYLFLECNPQGQWAFLDDVTEGRMSHAFASELLSRAGSQSAAPAAPVRADGLSLRGFSLSECPPCDGVFDALSDIAARRGLPMEVVKIDRSDPASLELAQSEEIRFFPTVQLIRDGRILARLQGAASKSGPLNSQMLDAWIERQIGLREPAA